MSQGRNMEMTNPHKKKGFTLIEMLIVMGVVAILTMIALPSYFNYIMKGRRAEGIGALNSIQLAQEKYRNTHTTYGTLAQVWGGVAVSTNGYYALAITNPTATGFTVTATAQNAQANDKQNGTSCQVLTLTVNGLATTQTPTICWSQ